MGICVNMAVGQRINQKNQHEIDCNEEPVKENQLLKILKTNLNIILKY